MLDFINGCVFVAVDPGTAPFVVALAAPGWRTPEEASAVDGAQYRYRAFSLDQTEWETGTGTYTVATQTLDRTTVEASSNGGAPTDFMVAPIVALTMFAEDLENKVGDAPQDGEQYARQDGVWTVVAASGVTFIGENPPPDPDPGQMWWESDSGSSYIWFDDGNSAQWVQTDGGGGGEIQTGVYLPLEGGVMTGPITLPGNPATALLAAPKQYVDAGDASTLVSAKAYTDAGDATLNTAIAGKVAKAGDVMTGALTLPSNPTANLHAATKQYVDTGDAARVNKGGDTMTGSLTAPSLIAMSNVGTAQVAIDNGGDAFYSILPFKRQGTTKFQWLVNANAAADLYLQANDDVPTARNALIISRSNGLVTLPQGQLSFPATGNPSTDANVLDDYEEGTWVPDVRFGGSSTGVVYSYRLGHYIKIGRTVHANCVVQLTSNGTGVGPVTIYGLPYYSLSTSIIQSLPMSYAVNLSGAAGSMYAQISGGQQNAGLNANSATGVTNVTDTVITDTAAFSFSGSYQASTSS